MLDIICRVLPQNCLVRLKYERISTCSKNKITGLVEVTLHAFRSKQYRALHSWIDFAYAVFS